MCKKNIAYKAKYYICNVSTCNRKRTGLSFCTVSCWDAHLPEVRHREAWAEERTAPTKEEWIKILSGELEPERKRNTSTEEKTDASPAPAKSPSIAPKVILRRQSGSSTPE